MAESLFDIFGGHHAREVVKNVSRQPFSNIENRGKIGMTGPIKPNEPLKKPGETKKTFFCNTGQALQSTPMRKAFQPVAVNVSNLIYTDANVEKDKECLLEDLKFTKPIYRYDNYHKDVLDFLPVPEQKIAKEISPPNTPPPILTNHSMEALDDSFSEDIFISDFSCDSFADDDLNFPDIY